MDAVRDVRYHSAKNRRKRQDKRDAFAAKRAYLGRTSSDVLHPPSSKLVENVHRCASLLLRGVILLHRLLCDMIRQ